MNFEKLFESLDEKIFTTELKESLETQFNEAVELKAQTLAEAQIETLNEKSEEHITFLSEKAEEYVEMKQEEMLESLDAYLDRTISEFVTEAKEALGESIKSEKADMIIEAFDTMLVAAGVEVSKIVEAKESESVDNALSEATTKYDSVVDELIALKEENEKLLKEGVIMELTEGLSIVESEKFKKLASIVEFSRDESYLEKLETIKESVKGSEVTPEKLDESLNEDDQSADWKRFV